jgi:hypothetical protein
MTLDDFRVSLSATAPPAGLTHALAGLWWDGKGDWKRAHESAQQDEGVEGSWVHAYLHRKEGDQGNASLLVQSRWQSRLPRVAGCRMARHRDRSAGIEESGLVIAVPVPVIGKHRFGQHTLGTQHARDPGRETDLSDGPPVSRLGDPLVLEEQIPIYSTLW